ncbi:MAG TPA: C45 family peptidase, partial [Actinomycetota bacterium]|nr:C45 family peptidase [Actinomycetota bacterium]
MTLSVVHASGSPRELGRAYGDAFGGGIGAALGFYAELAHAAGTDIGALGRRALPYLEAARARVPELVEELEGLVEGAGISLHEGLTLNCLEEVWPADACTTIVHGRFLLHAEQWYAGHDQVGVVVASPDDGPAFVSPTCMGFLPAVGLSAAGFAQGIDSLSARDDRIGVPRVLVSRLALGAPGLPAAVAAACSEGRAGGYAHVLAGSGRDMVVETTAQEHDVLEPATAHTNHYLSARLGGVGRPPGAGSRGRLERARELVRDSPVATLEDCGRVLSDHDADPRSICVHAEGWDADATVFGMAVDTVAGTMIVSDGRPC